MSRSLLATVHRKGVAPDAHTNMSSLLFINDHLWCSRLELLTSCFSATSSLEKLLHLVFREARPRQRVLP